MSADIIQFPRKPQTGGLSMRELLASPESQARQAMLVEVIERDIREHPEKWRSFTQGRPLL